MRYFNNLSEEKKSLFNKPPQLFSRTSPRELLSYALGATLYMPATREMILDDLMSDKLQGLKSMVICLEDAIGDSEIKKAEDNLLKQMETLIKALEEGIIQEEEIPLLFIRIRDLSQMNRIIERFGFSPILSGFVFPKFTIEKGQIFLEALKRFNDSNSRNLFAMPILEASNIIYKENRVNNLLDLKKQFDQYKSLILNIRIGATDFSSFFGLRRSIETTIYDVAVIRDCIEDIVNIFTRAEDGFVVAGPVWEYYCAARDHQLSSEAVKGLIREVTLDKQNGLMGKTIIHPSQVLPVQALQVVTHEEYTDAYRILSLQEAFNGAVGSQYGNKMNEIKPHLNWAQKIIKRGEIYGVFNKERNYIDLLR